jgi:hypothetical protein
MLDHVLGVGAYTPPTIYVGLSIADPLDDASGNDEPVGNNYGRIAHASWDAAASRAIQQTGAVGFAQASGPWGLLTHWTLWSAVSGGSMLVHGSLSAAKSVVSGNTPSFSAGELAVTFSASGAGGGWTDVLVLEMLDHVFGNGVYSAPTIYWSLSTTIPTDGGPNVTEPSPPNGYARKAHSAYDTAAGGASENNGAITFDTPSGDWGEIVACAMHDALTGGACLMWGDVDDQEVTTDDTVSFADGALDLTLS